MMTPMRRRTFLAGAAATALAGLSRPTVAAAATSPGSKFVPLTPTRLADTRQLFGATPAGRLASDGVAKVQIVGRSEIAVPADASAVVVNVVAVNPGGSGFLTVYPSGVARPTSSNVNYRAGANRANCATVKLGADGAISVYTKAAADLVVDIVGYYRPVSGPVADGRIIMSGPTRAYDSRQTGGKLAPSSGRRIALANYLPAGSTAAVINLTVVNSSGGYFAVLPAAPSGVPGTSTLNVTPGSAVAVATISPVNATRDLWVWSSAGGDFIIDVYGAVTGPAAAASTSGLFVPLAAPYRMLDTRTANNPLGASLRLWPGWTVETAVAGRGGVPAAGVSGIIGNVTYVDSHASGYLIAHKAGYSRPGTSIVNAPAAGTIANQIICPVSSRGASLWSSAGGHAILDVAGYLTGSAPTVGALPAAPQYAPVPLWPLTLSIPKTGQTLSVGGSTDASVIDAGRPGWFTGTGYPGGMGEMVIFGHRTTHGGPFRNLHTLRPGDRFTVSGDRRVAVYEVYDSNPSDGLTGFEIISADAVGTFVGTAISRPAGAALVACSLPDGTPTSTSYRIVVHGKLISYTNT